MKNAALKGLASLGLGAMMALDGSAASFALPMAPIDSGFAARNGVIDVVVGCGPRGCAAVRRPVVRGPVVRGPAVRGPVVVRPGARWVRPYRWGPGGAIAAGAAIGFVAAAVAVSWAPPPPQPGLCWYYTDPSQRQGFWDVCP